jgi:hypothetical protein
MSEQPLRSRRPRRVTLLALTVLTFTMLHLARGIWALAWWDTLVAWLSISPLYLVASGFAWSAAGLPLLWGLWNGARWAPPATWTLALAYTVYFWMDRAWLVSSPTARANWPFLGGLTVLLLAFCYWSLERPAGRAFFHRRD